MKYIRPTTAQRNAKYGLATQTGKSYLVYTDLPFPMRIAWDRKKKTKRIQCHKSVAQRLLNVFNELIIQNGELYLSGLDGTYYREKNNFLFKVKSEIEKL